MPFEKQQEEMYLKAAALCSRAEHCVSDIRQKLEKWGLPQALCAAVTDKLQEEKFIDENRFCRAFVKDKFRFNQWGRVKIGYLLQQKRIPQQLIDEAFDEIDPLAYNATLQNLLQQKEKSVKSASLYEKKAKLLRFAQSRGFETDLVYRCLSFSK